MQPVIGITTYGRLEHDLKSSHYDSLYYLPSDYCDAVSRAGGLAVLLPPGEGLFPTVLDRLDGIVFSGGCDIDPVHYAGDRGHPTLGKHDAERDRTEIQGVRSALARRDMPILCICRGLQVLNVALGGSLIEDVLDLGRGDLHRDESGHWTLHEADVDPGTRTAAALKAGKPNGTSGHHQALRDVAAGLVVTARAADGVVEAVEHADHPWCVGVQWHPEITAGSDPVQQNLFDALVEQARGRRRWRTDAAD